MVKKIYLIAISMMVLIQSVFSAEEGSLLSDGFKEIIDKEISFQWKVEGEDLLIRLSAPTEGWVAVGFNPSRVMKDADYKLAYVKDGEVVMEDHFGTSLFGHKEDTTLDGSNDFEVTEGKEEGGITSVIFSIPLNSGDENDTILAEGDEVKVLLAFGTRDNLSQKHKERTSVVITL
ncbi:MAG: DOMON domain-containing protein [Spirochaetaceae bacterium]|nr:DOMON domain-containing protein [Spirochaetaceae bacterium]